MVFPLRFIAFGRASISDMMNPCTRPLSLKSIFRHAAALLLLSESDVLGAAEGLDAAQLACLSELPDIPELSGKFALIRFSGVPFIFKLSDAPVAAVLLSETGSS
jgi:hypothetical protein